MLSVETDRLSEDGYVMIEKGFMADEKGSTTPEKTSLTSEQQEELMRRCLHWMDQIQLSAERLKTEVEDIRCRARVALEGNKSKSSKSS